MSAGLFGSPVSAVMATEQERQATCSDQVVKYLAATGGALLDAELAFPQIEHFDAVCGAVFRTKRVAKRQAEPQWLTLAEQPLASQTRGGCSTGAQQQLYRSMSTLVCFLRPLHLAT